MKMAPHPFKLKKLTAHSYKHLCAQLCLTLANIPKPTARGRQQTAADGFWRKWARAEWALTESD